MPVSVLHDMNGPSDNPMSRHHYYSHCIDERPRHRVDIGLLNGGSGI